MNPQRPTAPRDKPGSASGSACDWLVKSIRSSPAERITSVRRNTVPSVGTALSTYGLSISARRSSRMALCGTRSERSRPIVRRTLLFAAGCIGAPLSPTRSSPAGAFRRRWQMRSVHLALRHDLAREENEYHSDGSRQNNIRLLFAAVYRLPADRCGVSYIFWLPTLLSVFTVFTAFSTRSCPSNGAAL